MCSIALAADPPKPAPRSTDDALRDSLDAQSADDYDRALLGEPEKADAKDRAKEEMEKKLKRELGAAAQKEEKPKPPLVRAPEEMSEAQKRLAQRDAGAVTQQVQRQAVADLQEVIDAARKSKKSMNMGEMRTAESHKPAGKPRGDAKPRPTPAPQSPTEHPASDSQATAKPAPDDGKRIAEKIKKLREDYILGLPEHEREQMLELPGEYFLPEYQRQIEDYFRRLSAGKTEEQR